VLLSAASTARAVSAADFGQRFVHRDLDLAADVVLMAVAQRLERPAQLFVKGHSGNRFEVMDQSEYRHVRDASGDGERVAHLRQGYGGQPSRDFQREGWLANRSASARRLEAGGFAPPSEGERAKACYVA
jgi:hypothetical protein